MNFYDDPYDIPEYRAKCGGGDVTRYSVNTLRHIRNNCCFNDYRNMRPKRNGRYRTVPTPVGWSVRRSPSKPRFPLLIHCNTSDNPGRFPCRFETRKSGRPFGLDHRTYRSQMERRIEGIDPSSDRM